jgi:hypothetical protein
MGLDARHDFTPEINSEKAQKRASLKWLRFS